VQDAGSQSAGVQRRSGLVHLVLTRF
jgi:hypothetical protein